MARNESAADRQVICAQLRALDAQQVKTHRQAVSS